MGTSTSTSSGNSLGNNNVLFTGSCFCHAISFSISALPIKAYICHCLDCRRFSASSFAYNASFPRSALSLSFAIPQDTSVASPLTQAGEAEPHKPTSPLTSADPSDDQSKVLSTFGDETSGMQKFCSVCGTRLLLYCGSSNVGMKDQVIVTVGAIDGSGKDDRLRPTAEGWCKRREVWMPDMRGTEVFDTW